MIQQIWTEEVELSWSLPIVLFHFTCGGVLSFFFLVLFVLFYFDQSDFSKPRMEDSSSVVLLLQSRFVAHKQNQI